MLRRGHFFRKTRTILNARDFAVSSALIWNSLPAALQAASLTIVSEATRRTAGRVPDECTGDCEISGVEYRSCFSEEVSTVYGTFTVSFPTTLVKVKESVTNSNWRMLQENARALANRLLVRRRFSFLSLCCRISTSDHQMDMTVLTCKKFGE